ncbi:exosome complex protein Rrp4 [Candidatus Woesearchaeota archaeon]|nr:exosome complex protein Rrp4 [Candidatus Woesearchaeota archaeon]
MADKLKIKNREIAVPGEVLAEGMGFVPSRGIRRVKDKLMAEQLGMISIEGKVIKLIPLTGVYIPKVGDKIVAKVIDVLMTGWRLDTRSPYSAVLSMKDASSDFIQRGADLTQYFALGDYVLTKITNVTSQKLVDVSMKGPGLRKLHGGRIIEVNPHKVPRVIGKEGSMVVMIKQATGCNILVGQNGWIWIDGEPEQEVIAEKAIMKINSEAHLSGLTDRIKEFLEKETKKKITQGEKNESKK